MSDTVYVESGPPPASGATSPTFADAINAIQAVLAEVQAAANAAAASAANALAAKNAAWAAPAIVQIVGAPVTSVFGRSIHSGQSDVVATVGDYTFSKISGYLAASQMPALTGAVTSSQGSTSTTLSNVPDDTPFLGGLLFTNRTAPGTPASGKTRLYVDSTHKVPNAVNDAGVASTMVKPVTLASGYFCTGLNTDGSLQSAQPSSTSFSNLSGSATIAQMPTDAILANIDFVITNGGATIATGLQGWLSVPFPCTINSVTMTSDQSGSVTIDIWKCTYAQYAPGTHPVVGDSICAAAVPNINSASKSTDATLTGWTKTISAGDILAFNCKIAAVNIQQLTISLSVTKT